MPAKSTAPAHSASDAHAAQHSSGLLAACAPMPAPPTRSVWSGAGKQSVQAGGASGGEGGGEGAGGEGGGIARSRVTRPALLNSVNAPPLR